MSKLKTKKKIKKTLKKTTSKKSLKTKKAAKTKVKKVVKSKAKKAIKTKAKKTVKTKKVKKTVKAKKVKKIVKPKAKAKKTTKTKKVVKPKAKAKKTIKIKKVVKPKAKAEKTTLPIKPIRSQKAVNLKDLFTAKEMKEITKQLMELRVSLANIVKTKKELDLVEQDTGDVIDIASQSLDKEMFFELSGNEIAMLEDVDAALRRIDNDVFGLCEYCRKPIRKLRIKVIPQARYCLACQSGNEQTPRT